MLWYVISGQMRNYKRKTTKGSTPRDVLQRAAAEIENGRTIRSVAIQFNVNRMTLKRYITKRATNPDAVTGYQAVAANKAVFPSEMSRTWQIISSYWQICFMACRCKNVVLWRMSLHCIISLIFQKVGQRTAKQGLTGGSYFVPDSILLFEVQKRHHLLDLLRSIAQLSISSMTTLRL